MHSAVWAAQGIETTRLDLFRKRERIDRALAPSASRIGMNEALNFGIARLWLGGNDYGIRRPAKHCAACPCWPASS